MPVYTATASVFTNNNIIGSTGWSFFNPYYSAANAPLFQGEYTNYAVFTGFGFSIPSNEIIVGISVTYNVVGYVGGNFGPQNASDYSVMLFKTSAVLSGCVDHATANAWNTQLSDPSIMVRGSNVDAWGVSPTAAIANDSTFGVGISALKTAVGPSGSWGFYITGLPSMTIYTAVAIGESMRVYQVSPINGVKVF